MIHRLLFFLPVLLALGFSPAHARLDPDNYDHARNAFLHAERGRWEDARFHASRAQSDVLFTLIDWQYLLDAESGASFDEITRFMSEHSQWPEQRRLRVHAEMTLLDNPASDNDIIAWFNKDPPITGVGKIALAEALIRQQLSTQDHIDSLIRQAWIDGDFDSAQQKRILSNYGTLLRQDDHVARIDRLLWEEKISAADDVLSRVSANHRKLFNARIALIRDKRNASSLLNQVPSSLQDNAGLLFDRMRWRARRGDDKGVREMLLRMPKKSSYPEKWWPQRESQVRKAIDEHHYSQAKKLLAGHGLSEGIAFIDALWLEGWLQLEFLKQPKDAYDIFYRMYHDVRFPVSRARAAYWAGRAAESGGNSHAAGHWYNTASAHPTTFYGQLAALKYHGTSPLRIPAEPRIGTSAQQRFDNSDLSRAVTLCVEFGRNDLANRLLFGMIDNAQNKEEAAMIAALGKEIGQLYLSVRAAKKASQQHNVMLMKTGYPSPKTPYDAPIERALILAITRQESEFDPQARSPASARGMMQLLPSTAKAVARKAGLGWSLSRLYEPGYNWSLGSLYLGRMIDSYDGSYVMAIAAYNAGPGNVRKWVKQFGTPGNNVDGAIAWIEKIPFPETRNYVQRVLENLQVYRHLLADDAAPILRLHEDLRR